MDGKGIHQLDLQGNSVTVPRAIDTPLLVLSPSSMSWSQSLVVRGIIEYAWYCKDKIRTLHVGNDQRIQFVVVGLVI